ncbi:MAG TPA: histidinol-phosphatase, partial [Dehalococcoidia bacterium]
LNSNGIRRCEEIYPALPLLERAHAAGLPITLASDAHVPERVGANFDDLVAWARRAGYDEASAFVRRKREAYSL